MDGAMRRRRATRHRHQAGETQYAGPFRARSTPSFASGSPAPLRRASASLLSPHFTAWARLGLRRCWHPFAADPAQQPRFSR